jgi:ankyrin repeat protein
VRKFLLIVIMMIMFSSAVVVYGAPIHDAAAKGDWNTVESQLKTGVPVDLLNQQGRTPLFIAAGYGHLGVAKLLLKWGANPNLVEKSGSMNPTDAAKFNGKTNVDELLRKHGGKYHYKATWNP